LTTERITLLTLLLVRLDSDHLRTPIIEQLRTRTKTVFLLMWMDVTQKYSFLHNSVNDVSTQKLNGVGISRKYLRI